MTRSSKDQDGSVSVRPSAGRPAWIIATVSALFTASLALWFITGGGWFLLLLYAVSAVAAVCGRSAARYSVIFTALLVSFVIAPQATDHGSRYVVMDIAALIASGAGVVLLIWWNGSDGRSASP
jgi:glucan phosphoethanolaminetransferase (alkaline phosphatase superfamily)